MQTAEIVEFPMVTDNSYLGISVDFQRDNTLSEQALKLLKDYYCIEGEYSPQQAFARAAVAYSYGDMELAQRIYDYVSKGVVHVCITCIIKCACAWSKGKGITYFLFSNLRSRFIGRSY